MAVAAAILMAVVIAGPNIAWSKTITAPFSGSDSPYVGYNAGSTNYSTSFPHFSFANGTGSFAEKAWGGSPGWYGPSYSDYLKFDIPFRNLSGTRVLTEVNITISYSMMANYSFTPGTCPWVRTTHLANWCVSGVDAGAVIDPPSLAYLTGRHPFIFYSTCTAGCSRGNIMSQGIWASVQERNGSKGATYTNGSTANSLNVTGSVSFAIIPTKPLVHTGTLVLVILEDLQAEVDFATANPAAGGLHGGFGYASLRFQITSVSIVEN